MVLLSVNHRRLAMLEINKHENLKADNDHLVLFLVKRDVNEFIRTYCKMAKDRVSVICIRNIIALIRN